MTLTPLPVSPLLRLVTLATVVLSLAYAAYSASATPPGLMDSDFKIFRRMAEISRDGQMAKGYDLEQAGSLEARYPTGGKTVPYTYPPLTTALIRPLADLPAWLGYLAWMVPGILLYGLALVRLAGPHAPAVAIASASAVILNISVGQNGLLIAGLAGVATAALLAGRTGLGVSVAAWLALKPHLALGLPLGLVLQRRWRTLAALGLAGLGLTGLGFAICGPEVARAWLSASRQASQLLALGLEGAYPIERMASVYATLRTYGVAHGAAVAVHILVACAGVWMTLTAGSGQRPARQFGLALIASLLVSPYLYDYDLALLAPALALLVRDGAFDGAPRRYVASLVIAGLTPIPGAFSNWGLLGDVKLAVGAAGLIAVWSLCLSAVSDQRADRRDVGAAPGRESPGDVAPARLG